MKRIFFPAFLERYDRKLLLINPAKWTSRLHRLAWIVLLAAIVFTCYFLLQPNDPRTNSTVYLPTILLAVMAVVGFVFWIIYLLRFNVFKRFGPTSPWSFTAMFLQLFAAIGLMVSLVFIPSGIECYRADRAFESDELVKDVNRMNFLIGGLMYDSLRIEWNKDTVYINEHLVRMAREDSSTNELVIENIRYATPKGIVERLQYADSSLKINDTTYIFSEAPDYRFIQPSGAEEHSTVLPYTAREIYFAVQNAHKNPNINSWDKEYQFLKAKYAFPQYDAAFNYYTMDSQLTFLDLLDVSAVSSGLDNITSRKYAWYGNNVWIFIRVWFYLSLSLSLLVFAFRHTTPRTFFIGMLAAFILNILTFAFLNFGSFSGSSAITVLIAYILIFAILSWKVFTDKNRSIVRGIGLNLFLICVYFLPLLIAFNYFENREMYMVFEDAVLEAQEHEFKKVVYVCCEIGGFILLMVLLPAYFYRAYRRWYALPEA
jgi:hypothetical protein